MAIGFQVTFDSEDPVALAGFWAQALHYAVESDSNAEEAAAVDPAGVGPRLYFQRVPESKTAKNRVHLDLRSAAGLPPEQHTDALEAESRRLVALGARRTRRLEADEVNGVCIVMQDPEGNEFCLN